MVSVTMTVAQLRATIRQLPSDPPRTHYGKWYRTQKEHWEGWLAEYHTPGAYERDITVRRNAEYAYTPVVESKMLLWLIEAAGIGGAHVTAARRDASRARSMAGRSAAVRRRVPWQIVEDALRRRARKPSSRNAANA